MPLGFPTVPGAAQAGTAAGPFAQLGPVAGQGPFLNAPIYTPEQQRGFEQALQLGGQRLANPTQGFDPIENLAVQRFYTQTVPSLAERFTAMGNGQKSSAFAGALGQAGSDLSTQLANLRAQYGNQATNQALQMLQFGTTPQYNQYYNYEQPYSVAGELGKQATTALGAVGQGLLQGAGNQVGAALAPAAAAALPSAANAFPSLASSAIPSAAKAGAAAKLAPLASGIGAALPASAAGLKGFVANAGGMKALAAANPALAAAVAQKAAELGLVPAAAQMAAVQAPAVAAGTIAPGAAPAGLAGTLAAAAPFALGAGLAGFGGWWLWNVLEDVFTEPKIEKKYSEGTYKARILNPGLSAEGLRNYISHAGGMKTIEKGDPEILNAYKQKAAQLNIPEEQLYKIPSIASGKAPAPQLAPPPPAASKPVKIHTRHHD